MKVWLALCICIALVSAEVAPGWDQTCDTLFRMTQTHSCLLSSPSIPRMTESQKQQWIKRLSDAPDDDRRVSICKDLSGNYRCSDILSLYTDVCT